MPDFIVLVPIFLLPLGAMIYTLAATKIPLPARRWLPSVLLILEIIAILVNIAPSAHRYEISSWDLASFSIAFQLDGITLVLLLVILIPLLTLQLVAPRPSLDAFKFSVLSSAIVFICADNLMTTLFAWLFLDLALFAWRQARHIPPDLAMRALILGQLLGIVLFAGAVFVGAKQNETAAILIALALWARLGLFPFHWMNPHADLQPVEWIGVRGAAFVAGASLWLRWSELGIHVPIGLIATLSSIAFIAALIWIAQESETLEKIALNISLASIAVPLAIVFGGESAVALAFWLVLGIAFALAMFELGIVWQSSVENRLARLFFSAGGLSLAGFPLTPAALGRVGVYVAIAQSRQWGLLLLALFTTLFALASLWQISSVLKGSEARAPTRFEYLGLQILGFIFIATSLAPIVLVQAIGQPASDSAERALDLVIRTNDFLDVGIGSLALIAPLIFSFFLARVDWGYRPQWDELTAFTSRIIGLDWLARWSARLTEAVSSAALGLFALAEENPTVWILLVGLWIAIFVLTSR